MSFDSCPFRGGCFYFMPTNRDSFEYFFLLPLSSTSILFYVFPPFVEQRLEIPMQIFFGRSFLFYETTGILEEYSIGRLRRILKGAIETYYSYPIHLKPTKEMRAL